MKLSRFSPLAFLLGALAPAFAQVNAGEADPAAWLRQVYALYQRVQNAASPDGRASYALVEKRASRGFAALFKKNAECEKKTGGACELDWDFVIDGQDWNISGVKVGPFVAAGDKGTVAVSFKNVKEADVNTYAFVREGGVWKVDDVVTREAGGKAISIAKLLRGSKGD